MPYIHNKSKTQNWVAFDRSLMRDTRLKSNSKTMYLLFKSFAQTCQNVFLTYSYIATEVGYVYNGKYEVGTPEYENALKHFVIDNLQPVLDLGWVKKINNTGTHCDWEVYDHDCYCGEKSPHTVEKNLTATVEKNLTLDIRSNLEEVSSGGDPFLIIKEKLETEYNYLTDTPNIFSIVKIIDNKTNSLEYLDWVIKNKKNVDKKYILSNKAWSDWFWLDYNSDLAINKDKEVNNIGRNHTINELLQGNYLSARVYKDDFKTTEDFNNYILELENKNIEIKAMDFEYQNTTQNPPYQIERNQDIENHTEKQSKLARIREIEGQLDQDTFDFTKLSNLALKMVKLAKTNNHKAQVISGYLK